MRAFNSVFEKKNRMLCRFSTNWCFSFVNKLTFGVLGKLSHRREKKIIIVLTVKIKMAIDLEVLVVAPRVGRTRCQ
jgi:hypothetical protein